MLETFYWLQWQHYDDIEFHYPKGMKRHPEKTKLLFLFIILVTIEGAKSYSQPEQHLISVYLAFAMNQEICCLVKLNVAFCDS